MARSNANYEPQKRKLAYTALDLFITKGYENTTITEIMKVAKLTKASMYHYYSSKEEILDAAIEYAIEQNIEETKKAIEGLAPEKKILIFTKGVVNPTDAIHKLLYYKHNDRNSYAAYRVRELTTHAYIPLMEEIVSQGVEKGIFKTEFPSQAAEFMVLLGKSLSESNFLPSATTKEQSKRLDSFLEIIEKWLQPPAAYFEDFAKMCYQELNITDA